MAVFLDLLEGGRNAAYSYLSALESGLPGAAKVGEALGFDQTNLRNTPQAAIDEKMPKVLQYPLSDSVKYGTRIITSSYQRENLTSAGFLDKQNSVYLPLPMNIIDSHQVQYDPRSLSLSGAVIDKSGIGSVGGVLGAVATGAAVGAAQSLGSAPVFNTTAQLAGGGAGGAIETGANIARVSGYAPNEYVTILFIGPQYKRHVLKWKLSPNSYQESVALRRIINLFNNRMAPGLYASGLLFTFPFIFEIALLPNPGYLMKFKPAVCEAMFVNYTGGGSPAFYRDPKGSEPNTGWEGGIPGTHNAPESVEIEMRFIELEYWITGDFHQTNDPIDGYADSRNNIGFNSG